jgi:hypothetical protein
VIAAVLAHVTICLAGSPRSQETAARASVKPASGPVWRAMSRCGLRFGRSFGAFGASGRAYCILFPVTGVCSLVHLTRLRACDCVVCKIVLFLVKASVLLLDSNVLIGAFSFPLCSTWNWLTA